MPLTKMDSSCALTAAANKLYKPMNKERWYFLLPAFFLSLKKGANRLVGSYVHAGSARPTK